PDLRRLRLAQEGRLREGRELLQAGALHRPQPHRRHRVLWRAEGRPRRLARRAADAGPPGQAVRVRMRRRRGAAPLDRRRRRPAALAVAILALVGAAGAIALAAPGDAPIRAMRWASPTADPARAFGTTPTECLRKVADPALAQSVEI